IAKPRPLPNKGTQDRGAPALEPTTKNSQPGGGEPYFSSEVEKAISEAAELLPNTIPAHLKRWSAIKLLERDSNLIDRLDLNSDLLAKAESISKKLEQSKDDDIESIITNERYEYITKMLDGVLVKSGAKMTASDKIDRIVTNRILGIPIFLLVMWFVYYIAVSTVGTMATDWANDSFVGGIQGWVEEAMSNAGASEILVDCVVNGIIGGVGAVLGFVPQMAILFLLLSILEDVGYMVRIAFVMDRLFRKFGLSGKSFIPLLISSGCGIPGIMASRTIENENDRRMTIMTTTWIPCGAKLPVIALMATVIGSVAFGDPARAAFIGPLMYLVGIASVLIAAVMLKKTKAFHGPAAPFVMELPQYHIPQAKTVLLHTWERVKSFVVKAGTILFLACLVIWFLSSYGIASPKEAEYAEDGTLIQEASEGGFTL
ncbi:MAG: ferrous iron transporter B, partial [Treponemataceae bacterium]|nr:ferrous iron transporter B [Treponemataceae bacterium]